MAGEEAQRTIEATRRLLRDVLGRSVSLSVDDDLSGLRSSVVRLRVKGATGLNSVIAKRPIDAASVKDERSADDRFGNEWAALELLGPLGTPPLVPSLIAVDKRERLLILEDLGPGASLADLLLRAPRVAAEDGLVGFARRLGEMHKESITHVAKYRSLLSDAVAKRAVDRAASQLQTSFARLASVGAGLDIDPRGAEEDLRALSEWISTRGSFHALVYGDPCPDNNIVEPGTVTFLDFEWAEYGHVLLDFAVLSLGFPSCWCTGSLPAGLLARAESVYRRELASAVPEARDDVRFTSEARRAAAVVGLRAVSSSIRAALSGDRELGPHGVTLRQRLLSVLHCLGPITAGDGDLERLARMCTLLAAALAAHWRLGSPELPCHPALR